MLNFNSRGHTSIYLCDYLKKRVNDINMLSAAKGHSSFNGYNNQLLINDLTTDFERLVGTRLDIKPEIKIDIYADTYTQARDKIGGFTNGKMLDLVELLSGWRMFAIKECEKRDMKV